MRKTFAFISLLVILSLALSACTAAGEGEPTPDATFFPTGPSGEVLMPEGNADGTAAPTAQTATPTLEVTATLDSATGDATAATLTATEASTPEATEADDATPTLKASATARPTRAAPVESLIGFPPAGSSGLVGLAAMFDFRVVDISGAEVGAVADYVINTCDANIAYIIVERPGGERILVPYQATLETPNNGRVDVPGRELVIAVDAASLNQAPTLASDDLDMQDASWEQESLAFWRAEVAVSITAGCVVPAGGAGEAPDAPAATPTPTTDSAAGTPAVTPTLPETPAPAVTPTPGSRAVTRIALASAMLGADLRGGSGALQDGSGERLGTLRDVAIVPETGRTQFVLVQPEDKDGLVALPPGALTVRYAAGSDAPIFVLLVEPAAFHSAPAFAEGARDTDAAWFTYWQAYVPMTMQDLQE